MLPLGTEFKKHLQQIVCELRFKGNWRYKRIEVGISHYSFKNIKDIHERLIKVEKSHVASRAGKLVEMSQ